MATESPDRENLQLPETNGHPGFLQKILTTNTTPLTLNYLFDNIRNYTLATTVVVAGLWLLNESGSFFGAPYINLIFGIHVIICGLVLIGLNFTHSILVIARASGKTWPGYVIYVTFLVGSLEIVWISFWKFHT